MSEFQKSIFQGKLKQAEKRLGFDFNESLEENDEETDTNVGIKASKLDKYDLKDDNDGESSQLPWSDSFDKNDIYCDSDGYCFQTYFKKPKLNSNDENNCPVIFIGHHGAGSSGLTFAELSKCIFGKSIEFDYFTNPGFFTFDMRGHGSTNLINRSNEKLNNLNYNLSINQLEDDFIFIFNHFMKRLFELNDGEFNKCSIFLIGHSLGGSVLTKVLYENFTIDSTSPNLKLDNRFSKFIKGLVMVDIVEETAVNALQSMDGYLQSMPKKFKSLNSAISWHLSNGLVNNRLSCRYSIPSIIMKDSDDSYKFITDLKLTKAFWNSWFSGLSNQFTKIPNFISKLLVLANNDYLDKDLIIGQMQGKYQLIVFHSNNLNFENIMSTTTMTVNSNSDCKKLGHFIHEDIPNKLAISLLEFVERNDNISFHKNILNPQLDLINKLNKKWNVQK